jgi:hypothetical protein
MDQIMRELGRKVGGAALAQEQLQGLIRAGYGCQERRRSYPH